MAKFREKTDTSTINYMGARSFNQSPKEELAFSVVTTFIENTYYESKDARLERIAELVSQVAKKDPEFVSKLAIVLRKEFHMRSAFHVLVGEMAKNVKGNSLVRKTIEKGAERPDDLMEIASYLGKPIPNGVKKGIADSLHNFDEYQLAKYRGEGRAYSLVDLFNLVHPQPFTKHKSLYKKVIEGKLKSRNTWESRLTSGESHGEVWKDMIKKDELGYMALLRNLRNILQKADKETVDLAIEKIKDRNAVLKSKQLPFRFLLAYKAIEDIQKEGIVFEKEGGNARDIQEAVEQAVLYSVENIPVLDGRTMILVDNSGSMRGDAGGSSVLSAMSDRTSADIANLFGVLYWTRADNTYVGLFGDRLVVPEMDRSKSLFENFNILNESARECGPSTERGIFDAFEMLVRDKMDVDRIVIFSDQQVGDGCRWYDNKGNTGGDFNKIFQQYRKINPKAVVYSVDLRGYGNKLFSDRVFLLAGWSEKIFDLMQMVEKNEGLVEYIESQ